ncbi:MAG TPA: hypothetical protein VJ022_00155 [Anaerolineales bacterium]|nr:hypothetical protein [Anaerolineales bacterium]
MKIIKNEKLIKRNSIIGQWTSIIALLVLGGGLYVTFTNPADPQLVTYSLGALVLGFVLTQVGMYLGNRWGRSPRPDEKIDASLKGLQNDFTIYHFTAPASHLLVGPAGVWVLLPYRQRGRVSYTKNRWRVGNGGFLQMYMSIFGQEGIGRPDLEADGEMKAVQKLLSKSFNENNIPNVQAALIFMNEAVEIQSEGAPLPALKLKQLKEFMRQKAKEKPISAVQLAGIKSALPE